MPEFPLVCLIVSGGHSDIVLMKGHGDYTLLGRTRDDAAGEAFDKAARLLGLGYPGGPVIQKAAESGKNSIPLPKSWIKGTNDFSFSGIKSSLLRLVTEDKNINKADVAASFQAAVVDVLVTKTVAVAQEYNARQICWPAGWLPTNTCGRHCRTFTLSGDYPAVYFMYRQRGDDRSLRVFPLSGR